MQRPGFYREVHQGIRTAFMRWMMPALNPTERAFLENALKEKQHA